jgi:hypothetical protein
MNCSLAIPLGLDCAQVWLNVPSMMSPYFLKTSAAKVLAER